MNYKKEIAIISILSLTIFVVVAAWGFATEFENCTEYPLDTIRCVEMSVFPDKLQAISIFSLLYLIILIPLLFLKEFVYKSWRLFAVIAFPIILAFIFLTPIHAQSMLGIDREYVTLLTAGIFFTASLGIMIYKTIKLRKN